MTMERQSFSYQSWEPEDRVVFPGMRPNREEMEGTQDVLSTMHHSSGEDGAGQGLIHRDFLRIPVSHVKDSTLMEVFI